MTKYTRSQHRLTALIKDIFSVSDISIDTKTIILLLAGTLPSESFSKWLDQIRPLNPLNMQYKEINAWRWKRGIHCRNYIILSALQAVDRDVVSDELQQFITSSLQIEQDNLLDPALAVEDLLENQTTNNLVYHKDFAFIKQFAITKLQQDVSILDTYLHCRQYATPSIVVKAIEHAIAELLMETDLEIEDVWIQSKKLVLHALEPFLYISQQHLMLYSYAHY